MVNKLRPFVFSRDGHTRVSIAGQIDEVEFPVYAIEIDRLRAAGRVTGERQPLFPNDSIDEAGFADIASSQKSYFGQPVGGELLGTISTKNEF